MDLNTHTEGKETIKMEIHHSQVFVQLAKAVVLVNLAKLQL